MKISTNGCSLRTIFIMLVIPILVVMSKTAYSQQDTLVQKVFVSDSLPVNLQMPPDDLMEAYRNNPDFNYGEKVENPISFWDRFWWTVLNWISKLFSNQGGWPFLRYALILFLLVFIIIRLTKTDLRFLFFKVKKQNLINFDTEVADITQINPDDLIATALLRNDYRLAIRYHFLKALQLLAGASVIAYNLSKTNSDYLSELKANPLYPDFVQLVYIYEHIWYGNFGISETYYNTVKNKFNGVYKKIAA